MPNDQSIPPQGSILDDIREHKKSLVLSWENTPDGPLSRERDHDPLSLRLYDDFRQKELQRILGQPSSRGDWVRQPSISFKPIDEDEAFQADLKWYDDRVDELRRN